jgi:hypothetical protein
MAEDEREYWTIREPEKECAQPPCPADICVHPRLLAASLIQFT